MPLDIAQLPAAPHIVPLFKPTLAGVDFLNLRQVNLGLMAECVPGTNNATKQVRGYSLITWIYWVYPQVLNRLGRTEANSEELIHFREKVESLFVWGHKLADLGGVPGISAKIPTPNNGKVDLRFAAWKRSRTNTSLEAAVQYGPSLLDLGGLGLIHKVSTGIYVCNRAGRRLAEALDARLRQCPEYPFVTDISRLEGTEEQARALLPFWRFDDASDEEAETFRSVLWNSEHADENTNRGRRAGMIELVLTILTEAEGALDIDEIRRRLALPNLWRKAPLKEGMLRQSRSWLALQLRQLQRLAVESLMSWLEGRLLERGHQFPDDLVELAVQSIRDELELQPDASTEDALMEVGPPFRSVQDFQNAVTDDPDWFSPWALTDELADAVSDGDVRTLATGFYSLLMLHQCRPFLEKDEMLARHLDRGGAARQSLNHWFTIIDRLRARPLRELIDWTLKNLVISQHLAVGTQRFDGEKIRLRMILEEDGLESLVRRPWRPRLTPDRLAALLSLLVSCGEVKKIDGSRYTID